MQKLLLTLGLGLASFSIFAAEMPFIKAAQNLDTIEATAQAAGFEVLAQYKPYEGTKVYVLTSAELKAAAAKTEFGGYGAAIRLAVSNDQLSYNNPRYQAAMYRMDEDLADVATKLSQAFGDAGQFGADSARSVDDLRDYHYMAFMPYFDDYEKLASFDNHTAALNAINANLKSSSNAAKVYELSINQQMTLFGIAILNGDGSDETVMKTLKNSAAHLPYEILVSGKTAYMLHPKFRIAMSAPDLSMGDFMTIMAAPDAIIAVGKSLTQ